MRFIFGGKEKPNLFQKLNASVASFSRRAPSKKTKNKKRKNKAKKQQQQPKNIND